MLSEQLIKELYFDKEMSLSNISKEYNISYYKLKQVIKTEDLVLSRNYNINKNVNHNYFNNINSEEKSYFLGLLYADGYVCPETNRTGIQLQERDKGILQKFKFQIYGNSELTTYISKNPNHQNTTCLCVSSKQICDDLIRHGCIPRKSLILTFPTTVPDHLIHHFIRGYFDGDGHIPKKLFNDSITIVSTVMFNEKIKLILDNMQIYSRIYQHLNNKTTSVLKISKGKSKIKFLEYLYNDASLYIERKYNTYISYLKEDMEFPQKRKEGILRRSAKRLKLIGLYSLEGNLIKTCTSRDLQSEGLAKHQINYKLKNKTLHNDCYLRYI